MKFAALFLLLSFQQAPAVVEYRNPDLDLAFSHPKTWTFVTDKKGVTKVSIPVPNSSERASMEIRSIVYNSDEEVWLNVQKEFLRQMKRDVVRQWKEDVLGVPMLMTRGGYQEKGQDMAMLTGLMYSRTPKKLLFRLTAPAQGYDAIEFDLRNSLQSLHTIDGRLPAVEDPNRKITPEEAKVQPVVAPPKVTVIEGKKVQTKVAKGTQSVDMEAGGRKVQLRFDTGWTAEKDASGGFIFKNAELTGSVHVVVNSTLDSDKPQTALFKVSSASLDDYLKVATRDETTALPNHAGALVSCVWRVGTSAKGPIASSEAVGLSGEFYWLATYRFEGVMPPADRKAVDSLFASMSVELTP